MTAEKVESAASPHKRARPLKGFASAIQSFRKRFGVDVLGFLATPPELRLLRALSYRPESSHRELAIVMGLSPASTLWIRQMLDKLEARKLVTRERTERGVYVARGTRVTSLGLSILVAKGLR